MTKKIDKQLQKRGWKYAFLSLACVNLLVVAFLFYTISKPADMVVREKTEVAASNSKIQTTLSLNKAEVETIFSSFVSGNQQNEYVLTLDDKMHITGKVSILGIQTTFELVGMPYPTENGNLQVKVDTIRVGQLNMPLNVVLGIIGQQAKDILSVDAKNHVLYIELASKEWKNGVVVKVKAFDIEKDEYIFDVSVPNETIWHLLQQHKGE
ncbi:YpmS family protein [Carnobacteriaceae bacterium zg-84]|uniref:YpmS family protein n=1 Tax=Granulicatella sp. zg-84 TaxID=2678503 RepID=UPI0013BFA7EC|nr:YpmS family protein [Granulicatella sp. zg-84]NEW66432.1 DUF2140 family protein [Granulicatella sp. zg-84]QMI86363.1 YpmS family protein [Carnobacteriaceae bacterium zg-84]